MYKTAQGKTLDMSALISKNEKTRAVGNMKVNARGDTIDGHNRVVVPATQKVNQSYAQTVGNKSANAVKKATVSPEHDFTLKDATLDQEWNEGEDEIVQIKAKENKK
jgi:hypothetical protein